MGRKIFLVLIISGYILWYAVMGLTQSEILSIWFSLTLLVTIFFTLFILYNKIDERLQKIEQAIALLTERIEAPDASDETNQTDQTE